MAKKSEVNALFAPFVKAKEELEKKIKAEGEIAVKAFFKEYFETHPEVYGVRWDQYVPFFNDGDACTFSLYGVYTFATKEAFDDAGENGTCYDAEGAEECYEEEPHTSLEAIEDILQSIFGEHAKVAVTRTSIESEEFVDHD